MDPDTDLRQDLDDALQDVRARRVERESSPGYRRRLRERDELYVPFPLWRRRDAAERWAARWLSAAPADLPLFASPEWEAAPEAVKVASACRAALAWRNYRSADVIAADLRQQLDEDDRRVLARLKDAACDVSEALDWTAHAALPSHEELQRRRRQVPS